MQRATLEDMWFVIAFGLFPIVLYIVVRVGLIKSWYILKPLPGLLSGSMVYGAPAFGLAFVALALSAIAPADNLDQALARLGCSFMFFIILGFVLTVWCPSWLKPRWVQWLEYEYGYCLDILIEEARAMGRWNWESEVRTRAGLERWVQSVVAHHQQEIDERWEEERQCRLVPKTSRAIRRGRFLLKDILVPKIPQHRRAQEKVRLEEVQATWYFRPKSGFPGLAQQFNPGDRVIWRKYELDDGVFEGTKATVLGRTDKRVKIELLKSGQRITRYVKPEKLILEQYAERAAEQLGSW